jgi:hypothetical protein
MLLLPRELELAEGQVQQRFVAVLRALLQGLGPRLPQELHRF